MNGENLFQQFFKYNQQHIWIPNHSFLYSLNWILSYKVIIIIAAEPVIVDPCDPGPCGTNADCRIHLQRAICSCIPEHFGNPYVACRPECVVDTECARNKACINNKCGDPCPGSCGTRALCDVVNHKAMCVCPEGYVGDPFLACRPIPCKHVHRMLLL